MATLVTRAGERLDTSGAITGGSEPSGETLLAQRRELRALDVEVARREDDLAGAVRRQEELQTLVTAREAALGEVDAELGKTMLAVVAAEKDLQQARHEVADVHEQARAVAADLEDARAGVTTAVAELTRLTGELASAQARRAELEAAVAATESRAAEVDATLARVRNEGMEHRISLARERARRDGFQGTLERLQRADEEATRRAQAIEEKQGLDAKSLEESRSALAEATTRGATLAERAAAATRGVEEAAAAAATAREALEAMERQGAEAQGEIDHVRGEAGGCDVQAAERRLAMSHLDETIRGRYQRELAEVVVEETGDVAAQQERLTWLRERVSSMGDVNVAALGEVAELEERQRFLDGQRGDLEQALEDLKRTIARLNRTSRTRFRETFDRVDATFQEVFPKLFAGGRAHLRLTDETQILDSGVEIVVQLPGKRVGTLALLSGGEKALTAVSLIFALFLISPSPFCFLDEVDAPLDDANIGRFNDMVREMSAHSQFILITHNKRTMEVAETLYGITMEEPGVSEVVSVRLPE
jgi:chromosome segregation protein